MKKLNILIADDESIIRLGLERILEEAGHNVYAAENGIMALQQAEGCAPDLAILDIKMPEMDGIEAARRIRRLAERQRVPIIAMTAHVFDEELRRCLEAGMNDFITKPFRPAVLYRCLLKWLPEGAS